MEKVEVKTKKYDMGGTTVRTTYKFDNDIYQLIKYKSYDDDGVSTEYEVKRNESEDYWFASDIYVAWDFEEMKHVVSVSNYSYGKASIEEFEKMVEFSKIALSVAKEVEEFIKKDEMFEKE